MTVSIPVDYDLVIVGGTPAARDAACFARSLRARVALVEPKSSTGLPWQSTVYHQGLSILSQLLHRQRSLTFQGSPIMHSQIGAVHEMPSLDWQGAIAWAVAAAEQAELGRSPAVLASLGIDVIVGEAQFEPASPPVIQVGNRRLRSHHYLLLPTGNIPTDRIAGLDQVTVLTPDRLDTLSAPPRSLILVGDTPQAVELTQIFARFGSQTTLLIQGDRLLPQEDPEAAALLQAVLEAEGVTIIPQAPVTQVRALDDQIWVQAGSRAIGADHLLLAMRHTVSTRLNLEPLGVTLRPWGIAVNRHLKTTHPQIYAAGEAIGGYPFAQIAQAEAIAAVKNALLLPLFQPDYRTMPWSIGTDPPLARVGLTEVQARRRYGDTITVLKTPLKRLAIAHLTAQTTGFCKLIAHRNGELLGAHLVGAGAPESIGAIALALKHHLKVTELAGWVIPDLSFAALIPQTAQQWHNYHPQNFWLDWLETRYNRRRR